MLWSQGPTAQIRATENTEMSYALVTANNEFVRDLRRRVNPTGLVTSTSACPLRCGAPPSDRPRLPRPNRIRLPVAPSEAGVDPQLPRPARAPLAPRSHPADPVGSRGRRHATRRSRSCVAAGGVVKQSGHPVRPVESRTSQTHTPHAPWTTITATVAVTVTAADGRATTRV